MRTPGPSLGSILLRVAILIAVLVLATWGAHMVRDALNLQIRPDNEQQVHRMIMLGSAAYIGLLNQDGIAAPRGSRWNASTIIGNATRCNGILQNPLYDGQQVWNRVRMVKDPDTGRPVSRVNPHQEWVVAEVPELAILAPGVFEAAGKRKAERSFASARDRRRPSKMRGMRRWYVDHWERS